MFTLNMLKAFYRRALSADILSVHIAIFYKVAIQSCKFFFFFFFFFFFVNCVMVFFVFFFFFFFTKCTVLNGDVANSYVLGL